MEDLLELAVALIVIVIPLLAKKKNKKERPGKAPRREVKQKPVKQPAQKSRLEQWLESVDDEEKLDAELSEALGNIGQKVDRWVKGMEQKKPVAPKKQSGMQPQRLQAERLEAEPLIPESMDIPLMQEIGMSEGVSHTDDAGCLGGSLLHEADEFHQGMDFHPEEEHRIRRPFDEPVRVERARSVISAADLRRAVILSEILDRPVSMRE